MRSRAAARRYARALFSLAQDAGQVSEVRSELASMERLFGDLPALRDALFRPLHPARERRQVIASVCERAGLQATVRNFLLYLIDQRRLVDFDGIRDEYQRLADQAAGLVRAEIVTSSPLSGIQRDRLTRILSERTGRQVELEVRIDPDLIGGAVAVVDGVVFDGSLRTQLSQLRETLLSGGGAAA